MAKTLDSDKTPTHKTLLLFTKLLFSGERLWLPELAKQFNCSKNTVKRMIDAIGNVVEISSGQDKSRRNSSWYQIKHLPGTPYIGLTGSDVEKLALCRDLLARLLPEGIENIIEENIAKISTLIARPENRAAALVPKAKRVAWGYVDSAKFQDHTDKLLQAISTHTLCEIIYRDEEHRFPERDREPTAYDFLPIRFATENETLNVEGWLVSDRVSFTVKHPLTCALHRIISCIPTEYHFPDCQALPERKGAFGFVGFDAYPVRVQFSEEYTGYIKERVWSDDQEIIDLPNGEVELRFWASDDADLISWVLSFGSSAELIEPEELREDLAEEIGHMLEYYKEEEEH